MALELNYYKKKDIDGKLEAKQDALKFDNTPTDGSSNVVYSKGIKSYVDSAIAGVSQFKYEVVETLPSASASTVGVIYLVKDEHATNDNYDEYITIQTDSTYKWEKIGNTDIDLSNYVSLDGEQTISGQKTFTNVIFANDIQSISNSQNKITFGKTATDFYTAIYGGKTTIMELRDTGITFQNDNATIEFPKKTGTIALTSDIKSYTLNLDTSATQLTFSDGATSNALYFATVNGKNIISTERTYDIMADKYRHEIFCEVTTDSVHYMKFIIEITNEDSKSQTSLSELIENLYRIVDTIKYLPIKGFYYNNGDTYLLSHIDSNGNIMASPFMTTSANFVQTGYTLSEITSFSDNYIKASVSTIFN